VYEEAVARLSIREDLRGPAGLHTSLSYRAISEVHVGDALATLD
jgi:hypothetical protein